MSSRITNRKAPQPKVHRYIDSLVTDDFGRLSTLNASTAHAFAKKKLDTASQTLQVRSERRATKARRAEAREYAAAERGLQAELRESDHRTRLLSRSLKTKIRPDKELRHTPPKARTRLWPHASVALPKYDGPVIDRRGQRGVFMRVRYYSRRTAEAGVSHRVVNYIFNGAAVDAQGDPYQHSSIGLTIDETLCGFDHLEQVNWSAAKNAKLMMHGIMAVDYRQTNDEMMQTGIRWADEALGRFDLPYLVTLHAPPPDGDGRNWHVHIVWSYRPLVRTGDHEWNIGEMLRTDLDNPAAMKLMRETYAAVMTEMSYESGQNQVYTAKSNAARGLVHEPQVHLGAAATNRARSGEHVAANEENHERVQRSMTAVLDQDLRHAAEAVAKQQDAARAILSRWARTTALPMRIPDRAIAATMSASFPDIRPPAQHSFAPIVIPAMMPGRVMTPAPMTMVLPPLMKPPPIISRPIDDKKIPALPVAASQPAPVELANLRIQALQASRTPLVPPIALPSQRSQAATFAELRPLAVVGPSRARDVSVVSVKPPAIRMTSTIPTVPAMAQSAVARSVGPKQIATLPFAHTVTGAMGPIMSVRPPPPMAEFMVLDRALLRLADFENSDLKRREAERIESERTRQLEADAAREAQRVAFDRLFEMLIAERHFLAKENGRRVLRAALLKDLGLVPEDIATDEAQRRLIPIAERQDAEMDRIIAHVDYSPDDLRKNGDYWGFDDAAPEEVRTIIDAWRSDPTVQGALAHAAGIAPVHDDRDVHTGIALSDVGISSAWHAARAFRNKAMADWDDVERLDDAGLVLPGRKLERPGEDRPNPPTTMAQRIALMEGRTIGT